MEVDGLDGLLDLLEEDLDVPSRPVQFDDGPRAPLQIVRQKGHHLSAPVDLAPGAVTRCSVRGKASSNLEISNQTSSSATTRGWPGFRRRKTVRHVFSLGPHHPVHAVPVQKGQVAQVQMRLVEQNDLARLKSRAHLGEHRVGNRVANLSQNGETVF